MIRKRLTYGRMWWKYSATIHPMTATHVHIPQHKCIDSGNTINKRRSCKMFNNNSSGCRATEIDFT